jgi:hypothetical protein
MNFIHASCLKHWRIVCDGKQRGGQKCEACGGDYVVGNVLARALEKRGPKEFVRALVVGGTVIGFGYLARLAISFLLEEAVCHSVIPTSGHDGFANLALGLSSLTLTGVLRTFHDTPTVISLFSQSSAGGVHEIIVHNVVATAPLIGIGAFKAGRTVIDAADWITETAKVVLEAAAWANDLNEWKTSRV